MSFHLFQSKELPKIRYYFLFPWSILQVDVMSMLIAVNDIQFYCLHIIIFRRETMEKKELTEEEANALFSQALLSITKQNIAERPKHILPTSEHHHHIFDLSNKSPKKSAFRPTNLENPENFESPFEFILERSPQKISHPTCHKLSTDKSQSINEINVFSLDSEIKLIEKEGSFPQRNHQILLISPKKKIPFGQIYEQDQQKPSQINIEKQKDLHLESSIKQVKRDLQIKSKGKICKSQDINPKTGQLIRYNFVCKNSHECPFDCSLQYSGQRTPSNEKLYKLVIRCQHHIKSCIEQQQEIIFMKLTKKIDDMEADIVRLLQQKTFLKPKQILSRMAQKLGENNHKFIYKGLVNKNYHKAAKKYFDNLIYKVKNQMGIL